MNLVYIEQAETSVAKAARVAIAAQIAFSVACAFVLAQSDVPYRWDSVPPAIAPPLNVLSSFAVECVG